MKVRVLDIVKVLPLAIVRVALVAGAVIVSLLIDVAVATQRVGVTSVGDVAKTTDPVPVVVVFPKTHKVLTDTIPVTHVPNLLSVYVCALSFTVIRVLFHSAYTSPKRDNLFTPSKYIAALVVLRYAIPFVLSTNRLANKSPTKNSLLV